MDASRITTAIDAGDLDELIRIIDTLCDAGEWDRLVEVRDRSQRALERGRQLWPAASRAEYLLALRRSSGVRGGDARRGRGALRDRTARGGRGVDPHMGGPRAARDAGPGRGGRRARTGRAGRDGGARHGAPRRGARGARRARNLGAGVSGRDLPRRRGRRAGAGPAARAPVHAAGAGPSHRGPRRRGRGARPHRRVDGRFRRARPRRRGRGRRAGRDRRARRAGCPRRVGRPDRGARAPRVGGRERRPARAAARRRSRPGPHMGVVARPARSRSRGDAGRARRCAGWVGSPGPRPMSPRDGCCALRSRTSTGGWAGASTPSTPLSNPSRSWSARSWPRRRLPSACRWRRPRTSWGWSCRWCRRAPCHR